MTALPLPSGRRLTIEEYVQLGEDPDRRWELREGKMILSPGPTPHHMIASFELAAQLQGQLPPKLRAVQDVDIDLQLAPSGQPGWSRTPDLVVVDKAALLRVRREGGILRAAEVVLAVEIVSPGSRRVDNVIKRGEYADAGIAHYWIVDFDAPVSLVACHLAGELGYQDDGGVTGTFEASTPFPVKIEFDALV